MNMLALFRSITLCGLLLCGLVTSARGEIKYKATLLEPPSGYDHSTAAGGTVGFQAGNMHGDATTHHAILWSGSPNGFVNLHPAQYLESAAFDVADGIQVGQVRLGTGNLPQHAALWQGTPESVVDLHPPGFDNSDARGASGNYQVGIGYNNDDGGSVRALLWNGTAESVVNLHPTGYVGSWGYAVDGNSQVGEALADPQSNFHATLWHGTAESAVDLHPAGFGADYSSAWGVYGDTQVGSVGNNAVIWRGTAESVVDLHPAGYDQSVAIAVHGDWQVGSIYSSEFGSNSHAAVWRGTAESVVDLHAAVADLPVTINYSHAQDVAADGTVIGFGRHRDGFTNREYALLWTPYLVGDYNGNRVVDAADYVVWRDMLNLSGDDLPADGDGDGQITMEDYNAWKQHFGETFESTAGAASGAPGSVPSVPEPGTALLLLISVTAFLATARPAS